MITKDTTDSDTALQIKGLLAELQNGLLLAQICRALSEESGALNSPGFSVFQAGTVCARPGSCQAVAAEGWRCPGVGTATWPP